MGISGAVAERVKLLPFLIFTVLFVGLCYPTTGSWHWGGGWFSSGLDTAVCFDEIQHLGQGVVIREDQVFLTRDGVVFANPGKEFSLFDRIDAQVCLEVEVEVQHLGGVAGLFADDFKKRRLYLVIVHCGCSACSHWFHFHHLVILL